MESSEQEGLCCLIETMAADVPGVAMGKLVAFQSPSRMNVMSVVAELNVIRVNDSKNSAFVLRKKVKENLGLNLDQVLLVRPGWLPSGVDRPALRRAVFEKVKRSLYEKRGEPLFEFASLENLQEDDLDRFGTFGANSRIRTPIEVFGPNQIRVGNWVSLGRYGKLLIMDDFSASSEMIRQHYPSVVINSTASCFSRRRPSINIGDGTSLGDFFFLAAGCRIEIGSHVLASQRLFLTDCGHAFDDVRLPVSLQGNTAGSPLIIGDGCWFGIGVSVVKGVRIGQHCVIGAGSVVTKDLPDFAVVAGTPARVLRILSPMEFPSTLDSMPPCVESVIETTRGVVEASVGHWLDLDSELGADGVLGGVDIDSLVTELGLYFSLSVGQLRALVSLSTTLNDLGSKIHQELVKGYVI